MIRRILQLGTVNWQIPEEPSPGSGILHEAHHKALHKLGIESFSVFPATKKHDESDFVNPFYLEHDIPIFTRIPTSSFRFSEMSDHDFKAYVDRLQRHITDYINEIEENHGPIDVVVSHHAFINAMMMVHINEEREATGKKRIPIFVFGHGTALKLLAKEIQDENLRFLPLMQEVMESVDGVFTISNDQTERFLKLFPDYPKDRLTLTTNGINPDIFKLLPEIKRETVLGNLEISAKTDCVVTYVGKFAEWKRLDLLLDAAALYENRFEEAGKTVTTIIVGTGDDSQVECYQTMAKNIGLKNTTFVGPKGHHELARIYNVTDVGVFPSENEPFGLVFLECMGCGTPVIGANSGGPRDFVTEDFGHLIEEGERDAMVQELSDTIWTAYTNNWKRFKGKDAHRFTHATYTWANQIQQMQTFMNGIIDGVIATPLSGIADTETKPVSN